MSIRVTPYRRGGWEVDVRVVLPDGRRRRDRRKAPVSSKSAARRWGQARERALLMHPAVVLPHPRKEVPTLAVFAGRFLNGYARANRQKPSGIAAKETILRRHVVPLMGRKTLDTITNEDVQCLKLRLATKAPKTVNNVLATLRRLLTVALEWGVIDEMPCTIRQVKMSRPVMSFHDFDAYEQLVEAATAVDVNTYLIVLLGGEAGLRCGEMMALESSDVDLRKRQLRISRSEWKGQVTATKGGQVRYVPMTRRLASALRVSRHLRGSRVLMDHGRSLSQKMIQNLVKWAARRAGVPHGVHILRHTFCSHLSMRGAPVAAIQALAGHANLATTQRYMHLSPAAIESAIKLLDQPVSDLERGDIGETGCVTW
jgi:integrase